MTGGRGVRWNLLGTLALVGQFLATRSGGAPSPSWLSVLLMLAMAVAIVGLGWPIRKALHGAEPRSINSVHAVRTLVLAQAGALTGALVAGWYAGSVAVQLPDLALASARGVAVIGGAHILAGFVLTGAGMWVQSQCRIDPPDDPARGANAQRGADPLPG